MSPRSHETPGAWIRMLLRPSKKNALPGSRAVAPSLSVSFSADALLETDANASSARSAAQGIARRCMMFDPLQGSRRQLVDDYTPAPIQRPHAGFSAE